MALKKLTGDMITRSIKEEKYSTLKETVLDEIAYKISDRIKAKKAEILEKVKAGK